MLVGSGVSVHALHEEVKNVGFTGAAVDEDNRQFVGRSGYRRNITIGDGDITGDNALTFDCGYLDGAFACCNRQGRIGCLAALLVGKSEHDEVGQTEEQGDPAKESSSARS